MTWYLGDVWEDDTNTDDPNDVFWIKVKVNDFARPGGNIRNTCEIDSYARSTSITIEDPNVLKKMKSVVNVVDTIKKSEPLYEAEQSN